MATPVGNNDHKPTTTSATNKPHANRPSLALYPNFGSSSNHLQATPTSTSSMTMTSTPNTLQRTRSHTVSDLETSPAAVVASSSHSTRSISTGTGSSGNSLLSADFTDLSYLTHMQRVRARASFARQMSSNSSDLHRRRRESIAAVNFPTHLSTSGTGLNVLVTCKYYYLSYYFELATLSLL